MKTKLLHIASILTIATAPEVLAQETEMAEKVVMQQGIFWPKHETEGKFFLNNQWNEPVFDVSDPMAVTNAISSLGTLPLNDYYATIATLNIALNSNGANIEEIQDALRGEFVNLFWDAGNPKRSADFTKLDLKGMDVSWNDSLSEFNINGLVLNTASSYMEGANFSGLNLTGFNPSGKNLNRVNFVNTTGLTGESLNAAGSLNYANLSGLNVSGFIVSGKDLSGINFVNTTGLTGESLNAAGSLFETNLSGLNLSGFNPSGRSLHWTNLSNSTGISGADLNAASDIYYAVFSGMNLAGFNPTGKSLQDVDISHATGITGASISGATNFISTNMSGLNLSGFNPNGKSLIWADLSNAQSITATQLATASALSYITLRGTGITKAELDAALIAAGKNPNSGDFNTSTISF